MKKALLIGLIVALVLILVGGAGVVYAQVRGIGRNTAIVTNNNQGDRIVNPFEYGPGGMMRGYGYRDGPGGMMGRNYNYYGPGGMMGGLGIERGVLHDYLVSAFAKAVGLTVEQVDTRLSNGETFKQIAIAQGKTEADLPALAAQVGKDALNQAVADGVITQAQADSLLQRIENRGGFGYGFGNCPMWDFDEVQP